ncbi:uncharacterized protein BJ171DRAFT_5142 [Polychytrium aggregatum]|uniref:uncharacterized protein n=1 Tax=Polychytrium aggregatum TaxID=110093 RepID=UPI0022FE37E0|nr:uncharacterized protein BJ171DRAFT_5142 [Polychytrium aggregatum]KAI9209644.1 hypothetical protein BJ171DRAFT_5142 [Polychytrium aggregatum]
MNSLHTAGLKEVKMLTRTRVPIVKFKDPVSGIRCEMGIQNRGAAKSYELVKTYAMIDDRFKYLVLVVKYWAKMRSLNEPHFGTLSRSVAFSLVCSNSSSSPKCRNLEASPRPQSISAIWSSSRASGALATQSRSESL